MANKTQFKKGASGNPEGRPIKPGGGKILSSVIITNTPSSSPNSVPLLPNENTFIEKQFTTIRPDLKYIPFGSDNLFPNHLASLTRKSPSLRGILNWKTIYCTGTGFMTEDAEGDSPLDAYIKNVNAKNESLKDVVFKLFFDRFSGGNEYIEIVKKGESKSKVVNLYHKDHTTCRLHEDGKNVLLYQNWWRIAEAKTQDVKLIPLYPSFSEADENGFLHSIFHIKSHEPEFRHYGIADWIAGMDASAIVYKTNKWNLSRLDNSFQSSGTLVIEGNISPKEAKKMKETFRKEFSGEKKQGKTFFVVKQLGGGETKYTPFTTTSEGDWIQLHKQGTEDLLIVNSWFPSLSGIATAGQLGNTQQIRNEYEIAKNTIIAIEQEKTLNVLKKIIENETGIDADGLAFKNVSPLSLASLLNPSEILDDDEKREVFGYAPREVNINQLPIAKVKTMMMDELGLGEKVANELIKSIQIKKGEKE